MHKGNLMRWAHWRETPLTTGLLSKKNVIMHNTYTSIKNIKLSSVFLN